ncbi:MAG: cytochrome c oxidase subunit II [Novosphingobium sp.]|nr:cytochrome c oxidase subunit II [Novosphingobium sp.]
MKLGMIARAAGKGFVGLAFAGLLANAPALAQQAAPAPATETPAPVATPPSPAPLAEQPAPAAAEPSVAEAAPGAAAGGYTPMAPTPGKGMPVDGNLGLQPQFSPIGEEALWMHDAILMPVITVISLIVLFLLLWVVVRYRRSANPTPSKTTHNVAIEIAWTVVPALILAVIAYPSIRLLAHQYQSAPAGALTVKATGYQWYWGYTYPDNGGFEVISNMLKEPNEVAAGERARIEADGPEQLAADNRMVLPVGEPIRLQTTAADVIHAFAVPALWFKLDSVPGRINEKVLFINEPGVYFGQCSELCGVRHGYMPIVVEAVPRPQFDAWVLAQGGTVGKPAAASPSVPAAAPAAAPAQEPESSEPGAPGAGAPPAKIAA